MANAVAKYLGVEGPHTYFSVLRLMHEAFAIFRIFWPRTACRPMTDQHHDVETLQVTKRPYEHTGMAPRHELCPASCSRDDRACRSVVEQCFVLRITFSTIRFRAFVRP